MCCTIRLLSPLRFTTYFAISCVLYNIFAIPFAFTIYFQSRSCCTSIFAILFVFHNTFSIPYICLQNSNAINSGTAGATLADPCTAIIVVGGLEPILGSKLLNVREGGALASGKTRLVMVLSLCTYPMGLHCAGDGGSFIHFSHPVLA